MGVDTSVAAQLQSLAQFITSPLGMVAMAMLLLAAIAAVTMPRMRWLLLALLFWASTFGYTGADFQEYNNLISPLELIRRYSRTIVAALTLTLIIPAFTSARGWRQRLISPVAVLFLLFELLFCMREMFNGDMERGPVAMVVFIITFVVLCIGLPRWIQTVDDVHSAVGSIALGASLFCLCTFAQAVVNRGAIVLNDRMIGTTGNPQTAALILGSGLAPLCYLVARRSQPLLMRVVYGGMAALNAIFLCWTGSRTGLIIAVVGLVITFRYRLHRLFLLSVCTAAFVAILLFNFSDSTVIGDHLISTEDTRSAIWTAQLQDYTSHLFFGNLSEGLVWGYGENSYLGAASRYGTVGILPLVIAMGLCIIEIVRLNANKRYLQEEAMLVDLVTGCLIACAIGAWFEGYLLASFSFPTYCLLVYFALISALRDVATARYTQGLAGVPSGDLPQYVGGVEPAVEYSLGS
jgi:hypothetical protein